MILVIGTRSGFENQKPEKPGQKKYLVFTWFSKPGSRENQDLKKIWFSKPGEKKKLVFYFTIIIISSRRVQSMKGSSQYDKKMPE